MPSNDTADHCYYYFFCTDSSDPMEIIRGRAPPPGGDACIINLYNENFTSTCDQTSFPEDSYGRHRVLEELARDTSKLAAKGCY